MASGSSATARRWEALAIGANYADGWAPGIEVDDLEALEPRFREILRSSAGGWVNLEAETISGAALAVALTSG